MSNPQFNPVVAQPGDYPKMLYRSDMQFADDEALKAGLAPGGAVKTCIVKDEQEEADALGDNWTTSPMDFVGTADAPAPSTSRRKKAAAE